MSGGGKKLERLLVTTQDDLQRHVGRWLQEPILAIDTESNSLYAYRERVCLIQVSTVKVDTLVDPLALDELSQMAPVFAAPGIEKVFHAADYDLLCLKRDFGFEFANIFDTMIAARTLGRTELGLGALLEGEFGIHLDKKQQRANWGIRPLPRVMLEYARLDTHYLIGLRDRLEAELRERDLLRLAQEDFNYLCSIKEYGNGRQPAADPGLDCWRVSGSYDLEPQQAAVLAELCRYRDQAGRVMDRPLFKVINDHTLLAIAERLPRSMDELDGLPGMTPAQIRRHGEQLVQAVTRGLESPPLRPPRPVRQDAGYLERVDRLRNWRKRAAAQMGVTSDVVLPRDVMQLLAEDDPRSMEDLAHSMSDFPWRLEHFGGQILAVLTKKKT